ncbi:NUDIX hydrolase [Streptomyces sp. Root431]|nr:NUDIX hydrolase [Streptomyces sp. Root431]
MDSAGDPTSRSTLPGHVTCGVAVIDRADLELVHTVHMVDRPQGRPRIGLFFRAGRWEGVPEVREPDKCVGWRWWRAEDLPEPIVPYTRVAIEGIQAGQAYLELGWAR